MLKSNYSSLNFVVALFFLVTPLESITLGDRFSLAKLFSILVMIVWVLKGFPLKKSSLLTSQAIVVVVSMITVIWSVNKEQTINVLFSFLIPCLILSMIVYSSIEDMCHLKLYLLSYFLGCVIFSITCIFNMNKILEEAVLADDERLTSFGQNQNMLAFIIVMGIVLVLQYMKDTHRNFMRIILMLVIPIFVFVLLSTGSRMGMVLLGVVLFLFCFSFKNVWLRILTVPVLFASLVLLMLLLPDYVRERLMETFTMVGNGDFSGRGSIWVNALSAYNQENMLLGVGYGNFKEMMELHYGISDASHNTYLTYWIEYGTLLFLVPLLPFVVMLKYCIDLCKVKDIYVFSYLLPILISMCMLDLQKYRWAFLLGALISAWHCLLMDKNITNEDC